MYVLLFFGIHHDRHGFDDAIDLFIYLFICLFIYFKFAFDFDAIASKSHTKTIQKIGERNQTLQQQTNNYHTSNVI